MRAANDMPETITLSKQNPGLRLPTVTRLPRCVQHRLPSAQALAKCHSQASPYRCTDHRVPKKPYRLSIGLSTISRTGRDVTTPITNVRADRCQAGYLAVATPRCKKSLSMMDLTLPAVEAGIDLKSESGFTDEAASRSRDAVSSGSGRSWILTDVTTSSVSSEQGEVANATEEDPTIRAANVVCRVLVLNAWRRRRAEITQLEQQVEHLHLQIEFLRRLLQAENERVGRLNGELHREKMQSEEATCERDILKSEKEKLEDKLRRAEEVSQERSVTVGNLRNELLTTQDQLTALDAQMTRDREKLLKLREDKRILLDKVSASETFATERDDQAEKAEAALEELQLRLTTQVAVAESTQEQLQRTSRELSAAKTEKQRLEKRLKTSESNGRALGLHVASLENQLTDGQVALRRLESEYKAQMEELNELKERLLQQSREGNWSSRMLQFAGSVMRASILRTFAFLSSAALPP